ncbi:LytTR family DNA-binding domain-containing protein [Brevundimonas sp. FT23028]|uniref:LytTR family DNA-binding domain-containing protein n=1 Tax=Brevundimonas sp. FT23028 TaxID=3393748 RepID=UPI003B58A60F
MRRISFSLGLGLFAAYSYGATIVSAAWFLRRDHDVAFGTSLAWAALLYAPTVISGLLVWRVLKRFGAEWRAIGVLTALTPLVIALSAWASTAVDGAFRGAQWTGGEIAARIIARLPVALLLWTALCAAGLAAAHWRRALLQKAGMDALSAALAEARRAQAPSSERLMVSVGQGRVPVDLADVEWIASAANYVVVHWRDREGLLRETLQTLEARLTPHGFARSHRSTLVNLARVRELKPLSDGAWRLTLDSGTELVVSRSYRDGLLARLKTPRPAPLPRPS